MTDSVVSSQYTAKFSDNFDNFEILLLYVGPVPRQSEGGLSSVSACYNALKKILTFITLKYKAIHSS